MTTNTTAGIDLDNLEALARAYTYENGDHWYCLPQIADGITYEPAAEFITGCSPATVLQLIQLARRSTSGSDGTATMNPQCPRGCTGPEQGGAGCLAVTGDCAMDERSDGTASCRAPEKCAQRQQIATALGAFTSRDWKCQDCGRTLSDFQANDKPDASGSDGTAAAGTEGPRLSIDPCVAQFGLYAESCDALGNTEGARQLRNCAEFLRAHGPATSGSELAANRSPASDPDFMEFWRADHRPTINRITSISYVAVHYIWEAGRRLERHRAAAAQQPGEPAKFVRAGWFIREGAAWVATSSDDPRATVLYCQNSENSAAAAISAQAERDAKDAGALEIACIINKKLGDMLAGRTYLLPSDLVALKRFHECATDFDSGGHDVPKDAMARLREIGVVQSTGFGRHQTTAFGDYVLERSDGEPVRLPLKTLMERNADSAAAIQSKTQGDAS